MGGSESSTKKARRLRPGLRPYLVAAAMAWVVCLALIGGFVRRGHGGVGKPSAPSLVGVRATEGEPQRTERAIYT
jgi:hypothetical protein